MKSDVVKYLKRERTEPYLDYIRIVYFDSENAILLVTECEKQAISFTKFSTKLPE